MSTHIVNAILHNIVSLKMRTNMMTHKNGATELHTLFGYTYIFYRIVHFVCMSIPPLSAAWMWHECNKTPVWSELTIFNANINIWREKETRIYIKENMIMLAHNTSWNKTDPSRCLYNGEGICMLFIWFFFSHPPPFSSVPLIADKRTSSCTIQSEVTPVRVNNCFHEIENRQNF